MKLLFSLLSGLVFGTGLLISGMSDPAKVLAFLDLAGSWDPSLAQQIYGDKAGRHESDGGRQRTG